MTAELADFEPSTGHRHTCPWNDALPLSHAVTVNLRPCDCAGELYGLARTAGLLAASSLTKLGPLDATHVLVSHDEWEPEIVDLLSQELDVHFGPVGAPTRPLVLFVAPDAPLPEVLDEAEMAELGWMRTTQFFACGACRLLLHELTKVETVDADGHTWTQLVCPTHGVVMTRADFGELDLGLVRDSVGSNYEAFAEAANKEDP